MKEYYQGNRIQAGFIGEETVKRSLCASGFNVQESTREENLYKDIDCFIYKHQDEPAESVSIKTQHAALRTGNICFELAILWRERNTPEAHKWQLFDTGYKRYLFPSDECWIESWWHTGEANKYVFLVGEQLYIADKETLVAYVEAHGWSRVTRNTKGIVEDGYQRLHPHEDAICGLLSIDVLLHAGVLHRG